VHSTIIADDAYRSDDHRSRRIYRRRRSFSELIANNNKRVLLLSLSSSMAMRIDQFGLDDPQYGFFRNYSSD